MSGLTMQLGVTTGMTSLADRDEITARDLLERARAALDVTGN